MSAATKNTHRGRRRHGGRLGRRSHRAECSDFNRLTRVSCGRTASAGSTKCSTHRKLDRLHQGGKR